MQKTNIEELSLMISLTAKLNAMFQWPTFTDWCKSRSALLCVPLAG